MHSVNRKIEYSTIQKGRFEAVYLHATTHLLAPTLTKTSSNLCFIKRIYYKNLNETLMYQLLGLPSFCISALVYWWFRKGDDNLELTASFFLQNLGLRNSAPGIIQHAFPPESVLENLLDEIPRSCDITSSTFSKPSTRFSSELIPFCELPINLWSTKMQFDHYMPHNTK